MKWWGVGVALALTASCKDTTLGTKGCAEDKDCGEPASAWRCETQSGACYCRTNQACPPAQFCNIAGFCQDRAGCEKNSDCLDPSLFCETTSGTCQSRGRCSSDLHCGLGEVCDVARSRCVAGCRSSGDCPGTSCRCGDQPCRCTATTPDGRAACAIGECDSTFCEDERFCRFGERCAPNPDAGFPRNTCFSDYSPDTRPYCDNCTFGGGVSVCGRGANYCLIDTRHPGNFFCGADCDEGQACPRGYACQEVIVVQTQWACSRSNPGCPTNPSLPCTTDAMCPHGGTCVKPSGQPDGFCAGRCAIDEGDNNGFCSCMVNADCAQESCSAGECSVSRKRCVTDADCRGIRCVDFQGGGGCLIGSNCASNNGLFCAEVR